MKHEHLTIMFTDIKGFTSRTSKSSRKELNELLELHEELIEPVFHDFGGTVIKTIGDAFMVKFVSPTDAVLCGREIQRVLDAYNKGKEDGKIEVRVAINSGEVTVKGNDVFGETVNIAARLEGIADAGDIYFTEAVYLSMNKNEIPTAEVGYRHFKGVPDEVKVYKVIRESKKRGMLSKKEKQVARQTKKPFWTKRKKWILGIALFVLLFLIIAGNADKQKEQAEKDLNDLGLEGRNREQLEAEVIGIAEDAMADIRRGDADVASAKIEQLERISNKFGNPQEMTDGIDQLWEQYDEAFGEQETAEVEKLVQQAKTFIRDGKQLRARQALDELKEWRDNGYEGIDDIIIALDKDYREKFRR